MDPLPGRSGAKHYPILLQKGEKSYRDFKSSQKFSAKIGKRRNTHMTYKTFTRKKALPAKEPRQCLFPDVSMFCKGYASFKRDPLKAYIPPTSGYSHSLLGIVFNGFCFINLIPHFFDYLMCPYYPAYTMGCYQIVIGGDNGG